MRVTDGVTEADDRDVASLSKLLPPAIVPPSPCLHARLSPALPNDSPNTLPACRRILIPHTRDKWGHGRFPSPWPSPKSGEEKEEAGLSPASGNGKRQKGRAEDRTMTATDRKGEQARSRRDAGASSGRWKAARLVRARGEGAGRKESPEEGPSVDGIATPRGSPGPQVSGRCCAPSSS